MNTPASILLRVVILAATYAALNVYEVRTHKQTLWRLNRVTGEVAFCNRRACYLINDSRRIIRSKVTRNVIHASRPAELRQFGTDRAYRAKNMECRLA